MPLDLKRERTLSLVPATGSIAESGPGDAVPATTSGEWQVDLVPIPMDWDSPTRAVLGLVVDRSGLVLAGEALDSPSGETPDVVDRMAALLDETIEAVGHRPSLVRVRHPTVRAGLAPILASFGIQVRTARKLPQLDRVRHDFAIGALGMEDSSLAGVSTCAWSAWGIDAAVVGDLFAAAVEFWEAAPWSRLPADEEFGAIVPGSSRWSLLVMGAADETFGIALLESGADAERLLRDETPGSLGAVRNMGLALLLPRTADLPRAVKTDVKRHRWPVPHGRLPMLHTINTPAGGVTHSQIVDLTAILRAVVSLASAVQAGRVGTDGSALWSEPGSGVNFLVNPATLVL